MLKEDEEELVQRLGITAKSVKVSFHVFLHPRMDGISIRSSATVKRLFSPKYFEKKYAFVPTYTNNYM